MPGQTRIATGPCRLDEAPALEGIEGRRSLWCPAYEQCLEVAVRSAWRSWTCEACSRFVDASPHRKQAATRAYHGRRSDQPQEWVWKT